MKLGRHSNGFTLIELLVVVSIIGLLSSVVLTSLNSTRGKARDANRKAQLRQLQSALELYFSVNGAYPDIGGPAVCYASEPGDVRPNGNNNDGNWIPGLTPTYMSSLPRDPQGGFPDNNPTCTSFAGKRTYMYCGGANNYKIISRCGGPESSYLPSDSFYDPGRPNYGWMLCSGEPACSTW